MIYTFFYTTNAKNISLAWDQAPGKKETQQPLGSLRSPLFFLFYPVFCLFSPIRILVPGSDYHTFCFGISRRHKTYDVKSSIRSNQHLLKFAKCSGGSREGARNARSPLILDQAISEGPKKHFFETASPPYLRLWMTGPSPLIWRSASATELCLRNCLVPVRRFPSPSRSIRFGDVSEANGRETPHIFAYNPAMPGCTFSKCWQITSFGD